MIPYRFSFLFSFVMLIMGYRAYQVLLEEKLSVFQWIGMLAVGGVFCWIAYQSGIQEDDNHAFVKFCMILGGCRRNRVVFSCVCRSGEQMSPEGAEFLNRLNCRVLYLQPLRKLKGGIPAQINSALSHLNASRPYPVLGAEPEAVRLLQSFSWPHNYTQFQRVIEDLAASSERLITAENVRQALQKEQYGIAYTSCAGDTSEPLDLSRTLDEISQSVAKRVLMETGGNQSAAAKRLGISRTTLRRLVNA